MANTKCVHCVEGYTQAMERAGEDAQAYIQEYWSEVKDADTWVPSWQSAVPTPGQMVLACVSLPVCINHIQVNKPKPEQIASRSGLLVPR